MDSDPITTLKKKQLVYQVLNTEYEINAANTTPTNSPPYSK